MKRIDPRLIDCNFIDMIGRQWMLVTAGTAHDFNTMTASWGSVGEIWGKPAAMVFVRPQRHTFGYMERSELFTLSFFGGEYRKALAMCGKLSGRDTDKVAEAGLTPVVTAEGAVSFAQASLVLECRKMYGGFLEKGNFTDTSIPESIYPENDFHKMYVGEILAGWEK